MNSLSLVFREDDYIIAAVWKYAMVNRTSARFTSVPEIYREIFVSYVNEINKIELCFYFIIYFI
jgi:hypothetical protein